MKFHPVEWLKTKLLDINLDALESKVMYGSATEQERASYERMKRYKKAKLKNFTW